MKNYSFYLILLVITFIGCEKEDSVHSDLSYEIRASFDETPEINVSFRYKTDDKGWLKLDYLNNSWGDTNIFNCIKEVKVKNATAKVSFVRDSNLVKIHSQPNKELHISYSIVQDFKEPLYNHHRYRPIITKEYFHILGMRLFMIPSVLYKKAEDMAKIHVLWKDIPQKGIFHSSFGKDTEQVFEVGQEDLFASFFVGGDFRKYQFEYKNKPVYFVTRGKWASFSDDEIFEVLQETIAFQNKFWKDSINELFSVSLIPTEEKNGYSVGGSGFSNSFISFASNNQFTGKETMSWLYNHELLHKWIARTIQNENEVQQYWFSEGFTDYYAYKLLLKNNKISLEDYLKKLNEILKLHQKDPVNSIPNATMTFSEYWGNYKRYQKLPYRRGLIYAFLIDTEIKKKYDQKQSLDNLMWDLLAMAKADDNMRLNEALFETMLEKYLDKEAVDEFRDYILEGKLIDFKDRLLEGLVWKDSQIQLLPKADQAALQKSLQK